MLILGLQKTTLLDYPGHLACTIFTGGCDLRCPFCHNKDLVFVSDSCSRISEEEIFSFLEKRKNTLQGVCITGGEPTLQKALPDFIKKIKALGLSVKLDTNGFHPEVLDSLICNNLIDYVAIDIKNSPEKYDITVGVPCDIDKLNQSINILKNSNLDYEFRTTIVKEFHTAADIVTISKWISFAPHFYLQSFKDSGNIIGNNLHAHDEATLNQFYELALKYNPNIKIRGVE